MPARPSSRRLIAIVAAVAVAAVAVGSAIAYRQGPRDGLQADAGPLTGSPTPAPSTTRTTPPPTPTPTPSAPTTSVVAPTTPPSSQTPSSEPPPRTGLVKSNVTVAKLPKGRTPQITYLEGRTVRGGPGAPVTVPGTTEIRAVARVNDNVLAAVAKDQQTEMLTIGLGGKVIRRTPDVTSIVTTADGGAAAYLATRTDDGGGALAGATLYAEDSSVHQLALPNVWRAYLFGYVNGKVYFRAQASEGADSWTLYQWVPGRSKADVVKAVPNPTALSADGTNAVSLKVLTDFHSCSSLVDVASGKQQWRTCDYQLMRFTPDGSTVVGGSFNQEGYGDPVTAAVDVRSGNVLNEWKGTFLNSALEDDQHVLMVAVASGGGGDPGTKSAIIRCTIGTGACELATPISTDVPLSFGR
ncbi:hypothetical protein AB0E69_14550 [Kribbella sp. NPDC026611]|uniref:hypothetical protein n=1 Tax=Kribbella sp. NPDC026611 TaxID=3154911 RepID=UPI0033EF6829